MPNSPIPSSSRSVDYFSLLMKNIADYALILLDGDGRIAQWNLGAEKLFGHAADEVRGRDLSLLYSPEDIADKVPDRELLSVLSGEKLPIERWHIRKDGSRFWGSGLLYPLKDEAGASHGFVKIIRGMHDRIQPTDALLVTEKKMEFFLENMKDHALFMIGKDGLIASWNKGAERLLGYEEGEAIGMAFSNVFTPDDIKAGIPERELQFSQAKGKAEDERWHQRKDGGLFWASGAVMPLVDDHGEIYAFLKIMRDATERKRSEEEQKMRSIGRLAGGISHDFNNLLTTINGFCHLLKEDDSLSDQAREWVEEIHAAGERAATVTSQILAFSSRQILAPKPSQLNDIIIGLERHLNRTIGQNIKLKTVLDPQLQKVMVDPNQFELVLFNLASNAREAMPKGGEIMVETSKVEIGDSLPSEQFRLGAGEYAQLIFRDTGKGMSPEVKERIFEPFFSTKKQGTKSAGLGLSTVFGIVRQSGGAISVSSESEKGTEFKIYLPFAPENHALRKAVAIPSAEKSPDEPWILLVEDEPAVRKLTSHVLAAGGYRVLEAKDGLEALSQFQSHPHLFKLVLTDVVMPNMGGVELAQRLKVSHPDVPVAFMSGYTEQSIMPEGILENSIFIQKPYDIPALLEVVRSTLKLSPLPSKVD